MVEVNKLEIHITFCPKILYIGYSAIMCPHVKIQGVPFLITLNRTFHLWFWGVLTGEATIKQ